MLRSLWTRRAILLLDGIGALVTATAVGVVLPLFQPFFGVPTLPLRGLGAVAACFALFSLFHHFTGRTTAIALRTIAAANLSYCAFTLGLLAWHAGVVTPLAWLYFGGEIAVVVVLARRELVLARA